MRLPLLLQKVFAKASTHIDKRLHRLLLECAETLCDCHHLSIAGLGRALKRKAYVKHNIKTVDRLFGNETVLKNRHDYYRVCANWLVGNNPHPIVLVDWSGLSHCGKYHFYVPAYRLEDERYRCSKWPLKKRNMAVKKRMHYS